MSRLLLLIGTFFCLLVLPFIRAEITLADQPEVTIEPNSGTTSDVFRLILTIQDKNGGRIAPPEFEASEFFEITHLGTSNRQLIVNGEMSSQVSFSYQITTTRDLVPGVYELPAWSIPRGGRRVELERAKITIISGEALETPPEAPGANAPNPPAPSPTGLDFTQVVDNEAPYVGEQILYRAEIAANVMVAQAKMGDTSFANFWRESFGKNQERRRMVGTTAMYSVYEPLFPTKAGKIEIPPRTLDAEIRVPKPQRRRRVDFLDDLFSELDNYGNVQNVSRHLTALPIVLNVRELPKPPQADLGFIPVGEFQVSAKLDQKRIKQGESITLTIDLFGDGNLRPFELPKNSTAVEKDFKIYAEPGRVDTSPIRDRIFFKKTFQIALIPQRSGKLLLPTYEIVTFDPKAETYKVLHTDAFTVEVLPSENEQLVIRGGAPETVDNARAKDEIPVLGQDLRPQHIGSELAANHSREASGNDWKVLLALPLLTLLTIGFLRLKNLEVAEPGRTRRNNAASVAKKRLSALGSTSLPEDYLQIFRQYLGDRLFVPGDSITSYDVEDRLLGTKVAPEAAKSSAEVLRRLQRGVYGGSPAGQEPNTDFKTEIEKLIHEIEKARS